MKYTLRRLACVLKDDQWSLGSDHAIKRKRIRIYPIVVACTCQNKINHHMGVTMWMKNGRNCKYCIHLGDSVVEGWIIAPKSETIQAQQNNINIDIVIPLLSAKLLYARKELHDWYPEGNFPYCDWSVINRPDRDRLAVAITRRYDKYLLDLNDDDREVRSFS